MQVGGTRTECTDEADVHAVAAWHVARARERYPSLAAVDLAAYAATVVAWLTPLRDRAWHRSHYRVRRGELVWVAGAVGLHAPRQREAS